MRSNHWLSRGPAFATVIVPVFPSALARPHRTKKRSALESTVRTPASSR